MTYVVITLVVLLILNIYCSIACQNLFYESKKSSMIEKCLLASDEVSTLEVMNSSTVSAVIGQIESLKASRLLVTDQAGCTLYDSSGAQVGSYALLPEILTALEGNDVCSWKYRSGTIDCRAATPVFYYGTIVGCVCLLYTSAPALFQPKRPLRCLSGCLRRGQCKKKNPFDSEL